MDIEQNIKDGKYEAKAPYTKENRAKWCEEMASMARLLRHDLEEEYATANHPKAQLLWDKAWEAGHSEGYESVRWNYSDLHELITPV